MMSRLTSCALILAALAAVASWNSGDQPACDESRPVFGTRACCESHRVAGRSAVTTLADLEADRRTGPGPLARP